MPLGPMNTKAQKREGMHTVMHEFKHGQLHSGSKTGPLVKNRKQAIAIALSQTGQSNRSLGGPTDERDAGTTPDDMWRRQSKDRLHGFQRMDGGGFVNSAVPGRTDKHNRIVESGSYVLPADHVSALGENNSLAGADVVKKMFAPGTQFGARLAVPRFANGGGIGNQDVPVIVAGGEFILPPSIVRRVGGGSLEKGHAILDRWVLETRKKHIKKLRSLKPPKGADE